MKSVRVDKVDRGMTIDRDGIPKTVAEKPMHVKYKGFPGVWDVVLTFTDGTRATYTAGETVNVV